VRFQLSGRTPRLLQGGVTHGGRIQFEPVMFLETLAALPKGMFCAEITQDPLQTS